VEDTNMYGVMPLLILDGQPGIMVAFVSAPDTDMVRSAYELAEIDGKSRDAEK
jgi:hypothetical protein